MIESSDREPEPPDDPIGESRDISRQALEAATGTHTRRDGTVPVPASLPHRMRVIRASLDRLPPTAPSSWGRIKEAGGRLGVAMSAQPWGERRRFTRWPLVGPCLLTLRGMRIPASTLDIGAGGLMIAPVPVLGPGDVATITLELSPGRRISATATIDRDSLGHLAFERIDESGPVDLWGVLRACADAYGKALWQAAALAAEVAALFEAALRDQIVSSVELFGVAGDHPARLGRLDEALGALFGRAVPVDDDLVYVAAVDRNGHVAAEFTRPGEPLARRGQHVRDTVTLRAARYSAGPIVQTYCRLPGREPLGVVSDASAPVFVEGRRWGCVQIGRNPLSFAIA